MISSLCPFKVKGTNISTIEFNDFQFQAEGTLPLSLNIRPMNMRYMHWLMQFHLYTNFYLANITRAISKQIYLS